MGFIKKVLFIFLSLIVFSAVVLLAADNSSKVALKFFEYETSLWPMAWWMLLAFIVGFVSSSVINVFSNLRLRSEITLIKKRAGAGSREPETIGTPPALDVTTGS